MVREWKYWLVRFGVCSCSSASLCSMVLVCDFRRHHLTTMQGNVFPFFSWFLCLASPPSIWFCHSDIISFLCRVSPGWRKKLSQTIHPMNAGRHGHDSALDLTRQEPWKTLLFVREKYCVGSVSVQVCKCTEMGLNICNKVFLIKI